MKTFLTLLFSLFCSIAFAGDFDNIVLGGGWPYKETDEGFSRPWGGKMGGGQGVLEATCQVTLNPDPKDSKYLYYCVMTNSGQTEIMAHWPVANIYVNGVGPGQLPCVFPLKAGESVRIELHTDSPPMRVDAVLDLYSDWFAKEKQPFWKWHRSYVKMSNGKFAKFWMSGQAGMPGILPKDIYEAVKKKQDEAKQEAQ